MEGFLLPPPVNHVRLAEKDDLHRITYVAMVAFSGSKEIEYARPLYQLFPGDTAYGVQSRVEAAMRNFNKIVLVAEADFQPQEICPDEAFSQYVQPPDLLEKAPSRVIVGMAILDLKGHARAPRQGWDYYYDLTGCAQEFGTASTKRMVPKDSMAEGRQVIHLAKHQRDRNAEADVNLILSFHALAEQYMNECFVIDVIAVHPAYQRQHHARRIVDWISRYGDMNKRLIGVCSNNIGMALFRKLGFIERGEATVDEASFAIKLVCAVRTVRHGTVSSAEAGSNEASEENSMPSASKQPVP